MAAHDSKPDSKRPSRKSSPLLMALPLLSASCALFWACAPLEQSQQPLLEPNPPAVAAALAPPGIAEAVAVTIATAPPPDKPAPPIVPDHEIREEIAKLETIGPWEEGPPPLPAEADAVNYDFPVTVNKHVDFYIDYFQNQHRNQFSDWLSRSGRYLPMMQKQLREAGLPEDLAYMPLIESGYSLTAYSTASAAGPWQFMSGTARQYGLTVNTYVDERRDPVKSTKAAVAYLSDLYEEFGSWHLAVAAYNAGEGRIRRAVQKYETENFWEIAQENHLSMETRRYVPKLIAAIVIAKEPEKYGFAEIDYCQPLAYDTVYVPRKTALEAIAVACRADIDDLRDLNRELRLSVTPPDSPAYPVKVPYGKKELVIENLSRVRPVVSTKHKEHIVERGETLNRLASRYGVKKSTLVKVNKLHKEKLKPGQRLRIPYQVTNFTLLAKSDQGVSAKASPAGGNGKAVSHKVRKGETVGQIAKRYNVSIDQIIAWNSLKNPSQIKPGQKLALHPDRPAKETGPAAPATLTASLPAASEVTYYHVQGGDTLWSIAQKFQLNPEQLRKWNNLKGNTIHPGNRLVVKLAADINS